MGVLNNNGIGALTFGAKIPSNGKLSFPTGPTWMLYAGDDSRCNQNVPVLIRKDVFCETYLAEARVFRTYYSWILSMLLGQVIFDLWLLHDLADMNSAQSLDPVDAARPKWPCVPP